MRSSAGCCLRTRLSQAGLGLSSCLRHRCLLRRPLIRLLCTRPQLGKERLPLRALARLNAVDKIREILLAGRWQIRVHLEHLLQSGDVANRIVIEKARDVGSPCDVVESPARAPLRVPPAVQDACIDDEECILYAPTPNIHRYAQHMTRVLGGPALCFKFGCRVTPGLAASCSHEGGIRWYAYLHRSTRHRPAPPSP